MDSGVRQLQQLGKSLLGHASGILAWWKHRISNGRMEGINNKIKTLLRQTYGLRDERFFFLKLYSLHNSRLTLLGGTQFRISRHLLVGSTSQRANTNPFNGGARSYGDTLAGIAFDQAYYHVTRCISHIDAGCFLANNGA